MNRPCSRCIHNNTGEERPLCNHPLVLQFADWARGIHGNCQPQAIYFEEVK